MSEEKSGKINPGSASIVTLPIVNATGIPRSTSIRLKNSLVVVPEEFLPDVFFELKGCVIPIVVSLEVVVSVSVPNNILT